MRSRVTRKYQVTIPKEVREVLGVDVGDVIVWEIRGDDVVVRKAEEGESADIREMRGLWKSHPLIKRFRNSARATRWLRGHEADG